MAAATMDPQIVVWAAAQPVAVIEPTPMTWFEYKVTPADAPLTAAVPAGTGTTVPATAPPAAAPPAPEHTSKTAK